MRSRRAGTRKRCDTLVKSCVGKMSMTEAAGSSPSSLDRVILGPGWRPPSLRTTLDSASGARAALEHDGRKTRNGWTSTGSSRVACPRRRRCWRQEETGCRRCRSKPTRSFLSSSLAPGEICWATRKNTGRRPFAGSSHSRANSRIGHSACRTSRGYTAFFTCISKVAAFPPARRSTCASYPRSALPGCPTPLNSA